jgi:DNA polymerase (family 10)
MIIVMDKLEVAQALRNIALLLQVRGENAFKSRAYENGAERIAGLGEDLGKLVQEKRLIELPGIGEALAEKIEELVTTGHLTYFDELLGDMPPTILELLALPDLGPKKAAALWSELRIEDIAALEAACKEGKVRELKGFGAKTEAKLLEGIARYRRAHTRRLLGDVLPRAIAILERIEAAPGLIRASLAGSVRRSRETVADVDIVASANEPGAVMDALATHSSVAQLIGRGENKCSVRLAPDDLQVDLRVLTDADFATALHHLTGSKAHHLRLRSIAHDRGLKISEYGLFRGDEKLLIPDEAALYAALGMQPVPPELREDTGEVEAALEGQLPQRLVEQADIQGAIHSHSTWSDGESSLLEMARAAQSLGFRYLTVTEHSQAASYARGLSPEDLRRQWEEIDEINAQLPGFRLLKGMEADILEDGELDLPRELLEKLEVVIASIHVRHGMDEGQMTQRVLKALDHPRTLILGHPTGRLLLSRDPYALDMEAVFTRAAERGVAIEVNGNPQRLDLKAEHVRSALRHGVKLVISVDAHSVEGLSHVAYSVATARRGWAQPKDVLNCLSADEFLQSLRS